MLIALTLIGIGVLTGFLASRKGYNFWCWVFAAGIVGLLVLSFLPFVNKGGISAEVTEAKRKRGNLIGIVFSVIAVAIATYQAYFS
jgi:accessory gene regulator protein AgrB